MPSSASPTVAVATRLASSETAPAASGLVSLATQLIWYTMERKAALSGSERGACFWEALPLASAMGLSSSR
eukprot:3824302-Lingulodinium_polyedra.AAC.1